MESKMKNWNEAKTKKKKLFKLKFNNHFLKGFEPASSNASLPITK
jgi:hypothetical protein